VGKVLTDWRLTDQRLANKLNTGTVDLTVFPA